MFGLCLSELDTEQFSFVQRGVAWSSRELDVQSAKATMGIS